MVHNNNKEMAPRESEHPRRNQLSMEDHLTFRHVLDQLLCNKLIRERRALKPSLVDSTKWYGRPDVHLNPELLDLEDATPFLDISIIDAIKKAESTEPSERLPQQDRMFRESHFPENTAYDDVDRDNRQGNSSRQSSTYPPRRSDDQERRTFYLARFLQSLVVAREQNRPSEEPTTEP
ncbi:MAG: hypothetical protein M1822_000594 [Bathelium mastoideum]|nr:MAG: hypothetical protein M1822_000594 [Bathelium mastoideum]